MQSALRTTRPFFLRTVAAAVLALTGFWGLCPGSSAANDVTVFLGNVQAFKCGSDGTFNWSTASSDVGIGDSNSVVTFSRTTLSFPGLDIQNLDNSILGTFSEISVMFNGAPENALVDLCFQTEGGAIWRYERHLNQFQIAEKPSGPFRSAKLTNNQIQDSRIANSKLVRVFIGFNPPNGAPGQLTIGRIAIRCASPQLRRMVNNLPSDINFADEGCQAPICN